MNKENHILCISSMCLKKKKEKERTRKKKEKYPDQKQIANNSLIYLKWIIQRRVRSRFLVAQTSTTRCQLIRCMKVS